MKPDHASEPEPGPLAGPGLERLLRIASAALEMPVAVCFALGGQSANVLAVHGLPAGTVDATVPARRLRLDRPRIVVQVGRGPAAPEVAVLAGMRPMSTVTIPVHVDGAQVATVVLADARPRPDLTAERRAATVEDLRASFEELLRPRGAPSAPASLTLPGSPPAHASAARRRRRASELPRPDAITNLADRFHAQREIERRCERAMALGHGLALVIVSLDRFRRVNDALGHALGDQLLRQVAERLRSSLEEQDALAGRSGDEFIVVLDELGPSRPALSQVDRLQQSLREPFYLDAHEVVLSACFGVAQFPRDAADAASLFRCAGLALHQAKKQGPGRLEPFDASKHQVARDRLELERQLREALRTGQLQLHYQPKYAIGDRRLVGAEALLRWDHPEHGLVPPGRFIPVAEESGLIVPIGTWALNEVCHQTRRWLDAGLDVGRISVNVSGLQFTRHDFVGTVTRALRSVSLPPTALELELTETIVMTDVEQAIERLGEIRALGVRVSVDDFGTGYSSLSYLQKLPIDVLKIDRSFVWELDRSGPSAEQARSLAQAVTYLGHQLGLDVLAEGVETHGQLARLADVGCDAVQGFLFGRPMPPEAFERHVRNG